MKIFLVVLIGLILSASAPANPLDPGHVPHATKRSCAQLILAALDRVRAEQPLKVVNPSTPDQPLDFHSRQLAALFNEGVSQNAVIDSFLLLLEQRFFDFTFGTTGLTTASDINEKRGNGMTTNAWGRDNAYVFEGLLALQKISEMLIETLRNDPGRSQHIPMLQARAKEFRAQATKLGLAEIRQMATPNNLMRLYRNLETPDLHTKAEGQYYLPSVQFDPNRFGDFLVPQTNENKEVVNYIRRPWNNKQFDWIALATLIPIRAIREGLINYDDLQDHEKAALISMAALPTRLMFWELYSSDAWEEGEARRSSTVTFGNKVVEEILSGYDNIHHPAHLYAKILVELRTSSSLASGTMPGNVREIILNTLNKTVLETAYLDSKKVIIDQLPRGEAPDRYHEHQAQSRRFEDAALTHPLPYLPHWFGENELLMVIAHVEKLSRPSGILRYFGDTYLHPLFWLGDEEVVPPEFRRTPEVINGKQVRDGGFYAKNSEFLAKIFGGGLEARWSVHPPLMVMAWARLMEVTQNPELKAKARREMDRYFMMSVGLVTGEEKLAADGLPLPAWKMSEAQLPHILYDPVTREPRETLLLPCPHTLWWSHANLALGYLEILQQLLLSPRQ